MSNKLFIVGEYIADLSKEVGFTPTSVWGGIYSDKSVAELYCIEPNMFIFELELDAEPIFDKKLVEVYFPKKVVDI